MTEDEWYCLTPSQRNVLSVKARLRACRELARKYPVVYTALLVKEETLLGVPKNRSGKHKQRVRTRPNIRD